MKRVTYIISGIDFSIHFKWLVEYLHGEGLQLNFILLNSSKPALCSYFDDIGIKNDWIPFHGKYSFIKAFPVVIKLLKNNRPDIIHTHLWEASIVRLLAGKLLGIKKRIYTRHHGAIHHLYFPRAVWYDRWINRLASDIVVLSSAHASLLKKEGVAKDKLRLIPHGFDLDYFKNVSADRIQKVRNKYQIPSDCKIIGTIARFTHWKGIQYIIPAIEAISNKERIFWVLANATGDYHREIRAGLSKLPTDTYCEIEFEQDIAALYQTFDLFVHTPIHPAAESFGQVYVEALLSHTPSIFTISGVLSDIDIKQDAVVLVPFGDSEAILRGIEKVMNCTWNPNQLIKLDQYSIDAMIVNLKELYVV